MLDDGERCTRALVIDARGPEALARTPSAAATRSSSASSSSSTRRTALARPLLMDATVPQTDGFRFFYVLPLGPRRLLVEDTYSRARRRSTRRAARARCSPTRRATAASQRVVREEPGVLPMPWRERARSAEPASPLRRRLPAAASSTRRPATRSRSRCAWRATSPSTRPHDVFGRELDASAARARTPGALRRAAQPPALPLLRARRRCGTCSSASTGCPTRSIERFYALTLTAARSRAHPVGRPPRGFTRSRARRRARACMTPRADRPQSRRPCRRARAALARSVGCADGALADDAERARLPRALWERRCSARCASSWRGPARSFARAWSSCGYRARRRRAGAACRAELPLLIESLHAGSLIVDDIEDGSRACAAAAPALHRCTACRSRSTPATGCTSSPQALLARMPLSDADARCSRTSASTRVPAALPRGQALDLDRARRRAAAGARCRRWSRAIDRAQDRRADRPRARRSARSRPAPEVSASRRSRASAARSASALQMLDDLSGALNPRAPRQGARRPALGRADLGLGVARRAISTTATATRELPARLRARDERAATRTRCSAQAALPAGAMRGLRRVRRQLRRRARGAARARSARARGASSSRQQLDGLEAAMLAAGARRERSSGARARRWSAAASAASRRRSACRRAGFETVLFESATSRAGAPTSTDDQGFTFDAGPDRDHRARTASRSCSRVAGRSMRDYVELLPVTPFYRLLWDDGDSFDYAGDTRAMRRADRARAARATSRATCASSTTRRRCSRRATTSSRRTPFLRFADMVRVAPQLVRLRADRSVYAHRRALRRATSTCARRCQLPLAAGRRQPVRDQRDLHADPLPRAQVGRVLPARRHRRAGARAGARCSRSSAASCGCRRRCERIERRASDGRAAHRVHDRRRAREAFDLVVSNADLHHTYAKLYAASRGAQRTRSASSSACDWSMSLFVLYFGTDRALPRPSRTTPCSSARATEGCSTRSSTATQLPDDFSLYLHAPTVTDPVARARRAATRSTCCRPVPHLGNAPLDWDALAPRYAERILDALETRAARPAQARRHAALAHAARLPRRAARATRARRSRCAPTLTQSAWFRPHNRDPRIPGLYLVGAGTHPGAGVPGVVNSAKATAGVIVQDFAHERSAHRAADAPSSAARCARDHRAALEELRARRRGSCRRDVRDDARVVYACCRRADDAIDLAPPASAAGARSRGCARELDARLSRRAARPIRCSRAFQARRARARGSRARYPTSCSPAWRWTCAARATRRCAELLLLLLPRGGHGRADDVPRDGRARRARARARGAPRHRHAAHQHLPRRARGLAARPAVPAATSCSARRGARRLRDALGGALPEPRRAAVARRRARCSRVADALLRARATRACATSSPRCAFAVRAARLIYAAIGERAARAAAATRARGRAVVPRARQGRARGCAPATRRCWALARVPRGAVALPRAAMQTIPTALRAVAHAPDRGR